ncbi:MAG: glycosyltransferase family 2 protein [Parabacteroides sp.]|nr:glycosyltransferase family 2 protein [Parabacteroides sp.]
MVSVCMAVYNGTLYIKEQIDSILPQLAPSDELIVSDDGSTDATCEILAEYANPKIKILHNRKRHGVVGNFENALQQAQGDFIFLADQDDVWLPGKVEKMLAYLVRYDCVVSDCYVTDRELRVVHDSFYSYKSVKTGRLYNLFVHNYFTGCCMAFKREVLCKALPFPASVPMHDIWLGNVAHFFFKTIFIPDKLIYFRRHETNSSAVTGAVSPYPLGRKLLIRWVTLKELCRRKVRS